ncbi:MAG: hypothetical protein ACI9FD_000381 [Gammaproteobacteria bacterium]|jgi:uncharacterized protein
MKFHLEQNESINTFAGYDDISVTIGQRKFSESLIVSPSSLTCPWEVNQMTDLDDEALELIVSHQPEIVLLGFGRQMSAIQPRLLVWFGQRHIGLEMMDLGAACRTYNILAAEQRDVTAAIIFGRAAI